MKEKHNANVNSDLNYFKSLKKFEKTSTIKSLFIAQTVTVSRTFETSYEIFYLLLNLEKSYYRGGFN